MNSSEKALTEKYRSVGVMAGGELILAHKEALDFIEECREKGLVVLGMDFYLAVEGKPILLVGAVTDWSSSNDYTDANAVEASVDAALSVIKDKFPFDAKFVNITVEKFQTGLHS